MSAFTDIDLSRLPPPSAITEMTVDEILAEMNAKFKTDNPELVNIVDFESDPITALNQAWAYREYMFRQYVNMAFKAGILAHSWGNNLDHIAALIPLTRLDGEKDEDFKARIQLAPEGFSTAGPRGGYEFHARSAHENIQDVYVDEPAPGKVDIYILSKDGTQDQNLLNLVSLKVNDDQVRPLTDLVALKHFNAVNFNITAELDLGNGPDRATVLSASEAALTHYLKTRFYFGKDVTRAGILSALFVEGVENVNLVDPANDISAGPNEVAISDVISVVEAA